MRFRTRAFLLCFVPFALLLTLGFWMMQQLVQNTVREGLRASLQKNQLATERVRSKSDLQNSRFLKVAGENASLKAGIQLLLDFRGRKDSRAPEVRSTEVRSTEIRSTEAGSTEARSTVEDQLGELCERMGFDFLLVSAPDATPLAGVVRRNGSIAPLDPAALESVQKGLMMFEGRVYQIASVPIDQADENLATLSVGEFFDFSQFTTPAVLLRDGKVMRSSVPGVSPGEVEQALTGCPAAGECNVRLRGANYLSTPMLTTAFGSDYSLRGLENLDAAAEPVRAVLRKVFLIAALGAMLVALIVSVASADSIGRPLAAVIEHLRKTEETGVLPEFRVELSSIREVRDLTYGFNRAAASIREAREGLQGAYVEFIGTLASALDARDPYTAGHSRRVSDFACSTAMEMGLSADDVERIGVGSLLHDIGKIGVPDTLLQKTGRLTEAEFDIIKQHPTIGRRILEGVHGFAAYLPAVELHHENWDGTGYPHGQAGKETPIDARIIHVVDAYDAMTTNRPYRKSMTHERAMATLEENAGTQFDPEVVEAFVSVQKQTRPVEVTPAAVDAA